MTALELEALMDGQFPDWRRHAVIDAFTDGVLALRMPFRSQLTRAGGTISGPALMAHADTAAYLLTLGYVGPVPEVATADLSIHFLARPRPADVVATARLLRAGRRLVVSVVELRSAGSDELVAHATVSYALPSPPPPAP